MDVELVSSLAGKKGEEQGWRLFVQFAHLVHGRQYTKGGWWLCTEVWVVNSSFGRWSKLSQMELTTAGEEE